MSKSLKINLTLLGVAVLLLVGVIYNSSTPNVKAQSSTYGVSMDPSTGFLSGYAWSSNIGWIQFGGLSNSFPIGDGTVSQNAQATSGKIVGWARACAGTVSGDCTGVSRRDGWDGWISLSGTNYGVLIGSDQITLSGYAWGSGVIGWIDFTGVKLSSYPILIDIRPETSPIAEGSSTILRWSSTGASSCTITNKKSGSILSNLVSGSISTGFLSTTTDFSADCQNGNGVSSALATVEVTEKPAPVPKREIGSDPGEIDWDIGDAKSCVLLDENDQEVASGITGVYETSTDGAEFTLVCKMKDGSTYSTTVISKAPMLTSTCVATQNNGNDPRLYYGRKTTWTMTYPKGGNITNVTWNGDNLPSVGTTTAGGILYWTYPLIPEPKNISARGHVNSGITTCTATTTMEETVPSGGEI